MMNKRRWAALGIVLAGVFLVGEVAAQSKDVWTVLPLTSRGVDEGTADIFRDLLQNELSTRNGASFKASGRSCQDVPCAAGEGQSIGAGVVVFGSMNALGSKFIVAITVVDAATGEVVGNQKMTVNQVEDLDAAAQRIAEAIVTGSSTKETAELGNITEEERKPARRREGQSGLGLRVGGLAPLSENGYADGIGGVLIDASYWYETNNFAIEPRLGLRFSANPGEEGGYLEIPMDLGAYYILGLGDFAPFIGGGGGLRFISEERADRISTGGVIVTESIVRNDDEAFGFGVFARGGVLLFRTYTMRVALTVDYNVTFVELNQRSNPQSLTAGIGVYF